MENYAKRLGKNLRHLRGDQTLREFARKLGISQTSLNRLEMGKQNVTLATLTKFCQRLRCDIADLFAEKPKPRD